MAEHNVAPKQGEEKQLVKPKKVASDLIWSIAALAFMNGMIQIVIYPQLNRMLGTDGYGDMLYLMSVATIFGAGIGCAVNNARMLHQLENTAGNADYLFSILSYFAIACVVSYFFVRKYLAIWQLPLFALLMLLIILRYYSDVEYRLRLNYKRYFVYYAILSLGYLVGLLLGKAFGSWMAVFLLGEFLCVLFCTLTGKIYRPFAYNHKFLQVEYQTAHLMLSYLLYNAVIQLDRVMLRTVMDSSAVTVYYVASLLGKIIALLVGPLNSIIISYLTRMRTKITTRTAMLLTGGTVLCGAVFYLVLLVASPIVIKWLYPDIYAEVMQITAMANLGQIACFIGSLELTILLTVAPGYWQLAIQGGYAAMFVAGGLIGIQLNGLQGFVYGTLAASILRLAFSFCLLLYYTAQGQKNAVHGAESQE